MSPRGVLAVGKLQCTCSLWLCHGSGNLLCRHWKQGMHGIGGGVSRPCRYLFQELAEFYYKSNSIKLFSSIFISLSLSLSDQDALAIIDPLLKDSVPFVQQVSGSSTVSEIHH